jgi:hypothetical protein
LISPITLLGPQPSCWHRFTGELTAWFNRRSWHCFSVVSALFRPDSTGNLGTVSALFQRCFGPVQPAILALFRHYFAIFNDVPPGDFPSSIPIVNLIIT